MVFFLFLIANVCLLCRGKFYQILFIMDIRELTSEELITFFKDNGEKAFRAKQVEQWIWEKGVKDFSEMVNISKPLIELLSSSFTFDVGRETIFKSAKDGTTKMGFSFHDGQMAEAVFIPSRKRITACVSSQTGCALNCSFCATGLLHKGRNLSAGEIFDQVVAIKKMAESKKSSLSNIVYMGMGEPLLNYDEVMKSIAYVTGKPGLEMSPSRITLSTAGIIPGIIRLADEQVKFHLAISLHSAVEQRRSGLMPINEKYPLRELSDAIKYFYEKTGERVTLEYLMLKDINDSEDDAAALARFCRAFPVKINLIEYNVVKEFPFEPSTNEDFRTFVRYLEDRNMVVNIRRSKGTEIEAACGQLANRNINKT